MINCRNVTWYIKQWLTLVSFSNEPQIQERISQIMPSEWNE